MLFGRDLAIDLGTSSVMVSTKNRGVILREPSVVAIDKNTGRLLKIGMAAQRMLREMIKKVSSFSFLKPRIIISVPSGITEVEERAVIDAGISAGARKVYLLESPLAAALGAGLDISNPDGHMVVDIGGGTTDAAVLSLSGVVQSDSVKIAGDAFNDAIVRYIRKKHNVLIGDTTAEELKLSMGCVFPRPETVSVDVKGRCLMTGLPRVVSISTTEMLEALEEVSERVIEMILHVLEDTPPELVADISKNGIVLTGGGSQLWGFDRLIENRTNIPTTVADDPEMCVAYGLGKALAWVDDMQEGTINLARRRRLRD